MIQENRFCLVFSTINSEESAEELADKLVAEKAAACVSISSPVHSIYRWQNEISRDREWLMIIKTTLENYPKVEHLIRQHHPYQVPEILAIPVIRGFPPYLNWLDDCCPSGV